MLNMSGELEALRSDGGDSRHVQTNGEVTIPKRLREKYDLGPGSEVVIGENEERGEVVIVPL